MDFEEVDRTSKLICKDKLLVLQGFLGEAANVAEDVRAVVQLQEQEQLLSGDGPLPTPLKDRMSPARSTCTRYSRHADQQDWTIRAKQQSGHAAPASPPSSAIVDDLMQQRASTHERGATTSGRASSTSGSRTTGRELRLSAAGATSGVSLQELVSRAQASQQAHVITQVSPSPPPGAAGNSSNSVLRARPKAAVSVSGTPASAAVAATTTAPSQAPAAGGIVLVGSHARAPRSESGSAHGGVTGAALPAATAPWEGRLTARTSWAAGDASSGSRCGNASSTAAKASIMAQWPVHGATGASGACEQAAAPAVYPSPPPTARSARPGSAAHGPNKQAGGLCSTGQRQQPQQQQQQPSPPPPPPQQQVSSPASQPADSAACELPALKPEPKGTSFTFSDFIYQATGLNQKGRGMGFSRRNATCPGIAAEPPAAAGFANRSSSSTYGAVTAPSPSMLASTQTRAQGSPLTAHSSNPLDKQGRQSSLSGTSAADGLATPASHEAIPTPGPPLVNGAPMLMNIAQYKQMETQQRGGKPPEPDSMVRSSLTGLAAAAAQLRQNKGAPQASPAGSGTAAVFSLQSALRSTGPAAGGAADASPAATDAAAATATATAAATSAAQRALAMVHGSALKPTGVQAAAPGVLLRSPQPTDPRAADASVVLDKYYVLQAQVAVTPLLKPNTRAKDPAESLRISTEQLKRDKNMRHKQHN